MSIHKKVIQSMDKKEVVIVPYHYAPNGDGNKDVYFLGNMPLPFRYLIAIRNYSTLMKK